MIVVVLFIPYIYIHIYVCANQQKYSNSGLAGRIDQNLIIRSDINLKS